MAEPFADRLLRRVRGLGHPLCVGIDPHLDRIPPLFRRGSMRAGEKQTADAVADFALALLDRVAGRVACVKPQSAFFEALGWRGIEALDRVLRGARDRELLVVLDVKRGDIGSTAAGYASAYLEEDAPLRADAITVNPYLGCDSLEPFLQAAQAAGAGLFVLVRNSNPGSRDLQEQLVDGRPLYRHVAEWLAEPGHRLEGPATGWSALGAVVGANAPVAAREVRQQLPRQLLLVPGYGAQGARAQEALAGFVPGPEGVLEGGLVSSSRAVIFPEAGDAGGAGGWERAVETALQRSIAELVRAVAPGAISGHC